MCAQESVNEIRKVVNHPYAKIRHEAISALEKLGDIDMAEFLEPFIRDPDLNVKVAALSALLRQPIDLAVPILVQSIQDNRFDQLPLEEKQPVFETLGRNGGRTAVDSLKKILLGARGNLKLSGGQIEKMQMAINALETIGTKEAISVILEVGENGPAEMKAACHLALKKRLGL
jgi:hypothetical protein